MSPADQWSRREFLRCTGILALAMSSGWIVRTMPEQPGFVAWGQEDMALGRLVWPFAELPGPRGERLGERGQ